MQFSRHTIICIIALLTSSFLFSQTENKKYDFTWYTADDNNLPQNSVKSIVKDKFGFIWLATENGIVRYDGQRFYTFSTDNVKGMIDNRMLTFKGSSSKDTIVIRNDKRQFLTIANTKVSLIPPNKIPLKFQASYYRYLENPFIRTEYINLYLRNGTYYRVSEDSILLLRDNNKLINRLAYNSKDAGSVFITGQDLFILKDFKNYSRIKNGRVYSGKFYNTDDAGSKIYNNQAANQTYLKSGRNLYLLQNTNGILHQKLIFDAFDDSMNIASIYYDAIAGILYLGSSSKGLLVVKKKIFINIHGENGNRVYYAQIPFQKNNSLVPTGEVLSENGSFKKFNFDKDNDNYIFFKDNKGNIWTKGHNVLYRFTKESNYNKFNKWIFKDRITEIFENYNKNIIVVLTINGQPKGEIYIMNPTSGKLAFNFHMPLNFSTSFMIQTEKNIIWTGSGTGFHKVNLLTKKTENIKEISKTYVRSIYSTNPDEIWVTTYDSGFYLYKPSVKKVVHFPFDDNKFLVSAHCIIMDKNNFFWIPTNKGLFQVSKQSLLDYANNKNEKIYYHYYNKSNGFATNEFNGGCRPCGIELSNNKISFPSMSGIVLVDPTTIKPNLPSSGIYFDEAEVNGKQTPIEGNTLSVDQNFGRLKLYITSPYFGNKQNLNIEVKLDGKVSQDWIKLNDDNISFSSLPPGKYELTARKLSGFDSKYQYKVLYINIPPAFYQTIGFHIFLAIVGLFFIIYIVKIRIKYIRRKNILLKKKIAEQTFQLRSTISTLRKTKENLRQEISNHKKLIGTITHDIKSPLRYLAMTGKHIYQNSGDIEDVQEGVKAMYTSSFQLYNFVDNLLEYAKVSESEEENLSEPYYSLSDLVEEKIKIFLNIAETQKTSIINTISSNEKVNISRLLFSIIIHNLLDNAVKNTLSGKIIFSSGHKGEEIFLSIEDTGNGMAPHLVNFYNKLVDSKPVQYNKKGGMGLQMISELIVIVNGKMRIESSINKGTKITIWFTNTIKA